MWTVISIVSLILAVLSSLLALTLHQELTRVRKALISTMQALLLLDTQLSELRDYTAENGKQVEELLTKLRRVLGIVELPSIQDPEIRS